MRDESFVRINGLHKSFGQGAVRVFTGLDLEMSRQDRLVVIGPSGGGKSTLLRCIMGLDPIDAGEIRIDGKSYISTGEAARRTVSIGRSSVRSAWCSSITPCSPI